MNRKIRLGLMVVALPLALFLPAMAKALTCTNIGGVDVSGNCTLSTVFTCTTSPTTVTIPGNFTITATGGINCDGASGAPRRSGKTWPSTSWAAI